MIERDLFKAIQMLFDHYKDWQYICEGNHAQIDKQTHIWLVQESFDKVDAHRKEY